jgi:hypothetical protein
MDQQVRGSTPLGCTTSNLQLVYSVLLLVFILRANLKTAFLPVPPVVQ